MPAPPTRRLLLVEDSPDDAELLAAALRGAGYEFTLQRVETERDFREALAGLAPDAILCDYHLPRFSMSRALAIVREELRLDLPFIVVSRLIGEEAAVEAMKRGATDYLLKGRLGRLGAAIDSALERIESRRERARAEAALRRSDLVSRSLLDSLAMRVALLSGEGCVVAANSAWQRAHREETGHPQAEAVGSDFLEALALRERDGGLAGMGEGVRSVLERRARSFALEYQLPGRAGARWELLRAEPLADGAPGAVLSIEDITARMLSHLAIHDAHRRLQRLSQRVLRVQEEERRALAQRLEGDIAEPLAAQKAALLDLALALAGTGHEPRLRMALATSDRVLAQLAHLWTSLRPPSLQEGGLQGALEALAASESRATGATVQCRAALEERLPVTVEIAAYRIAQEALDGALRHAGAREVAIESHIQAGILRLAIRDDGAGSRPSAAGLMAMSERAELAGGRLRERALPAGGKLVTVSFPLGIPDA